MKRKILSLGFLALAIIFSSCRNNSTKSQLNALQGDLIIFHAGSLSVPFKLIVEEFEKEYPGSNILLEAAGSVACARKITELNKDCDIMASADYQVIDRFLIPDHTDWNISFAANEMVIAYTNKSKKANVITLENWHEILALPDVIYGRADPNSDPCGYRSVMTTQLEALKKNDSTILDLLEKDKNYMRPKEVDLLGLLESNAIDYIYIYKSVAQQHHLNYLNLNDSINLSNPNLKEWYAKAKVEISGKKPGEYISLFGSPMVYGITKLRNAPNPELANAFLEFFFDSTKGMKIIEEQGQANIMPTLSLSFEEIPNSFKKYAIKQVD